MTRDLNLFVSPSVRLVKSRSGVHARTSPRPMGVGRNLDQSIFRSSSKAVNEAKPMRRRRF